jgi:hypothetical protein
LPLLALYYSAYYLKNISVFFTQTKYLVALAQCLLNRTKHGLWQSAFSDHEVLIAKVMTYLGNPFTGHD